MRYKVELLNLSETGQERELFHLVVYAANENEAVIKAQKEYAADIPILPHRRRILPGFHMAHGKKIVGDEQSGNA